ncbi:RNA/RNP complex-1-interacting phosphatase-like isoform X1 [Alosa sapidissima]|uniref:RNA/RNP complex-1-interacting phosphatase-like isoform X1 n=2 Tax=Alosa sapidissima TaxID=34773 RepID=UPI001C0A408D|nr:RNA/RNP complex-1-interacting phosphatase-like isoform X1 [Alosa sapidissima]
MRGIHPLLVFSRTVTCRNFVKAFQLCYRTSFQRDIHTTHAKRMSHSQHKKNGIPDRWTDYKAVGKRIPGTRFVAFKVPLKQSLLSRLTASEAFGPNDLVHVLEEEKQQLGLIIDLTFTTRYYKPQDLPDSVYYVKIFAAGHKVPSDPTILSFKRAVRKFLLDNEDNDKLIGVHCTRGLNRTGYLVCRYLIDVDGIEPKKAIELFNTSRGHNIERQNYIDDLQQGPKRSNEGMEEPDQEPAQGYANQRHPNAPFAQTQVSKHHPPFRNQRPRQRDWDVPYEDSFRPPHAWGMNHGFNGGPGLLPPPPGFYPGPGLFPDPPPFMRLPQRHHPSDRDRRGPPHPCAPPYPILPRYRFSGPQEGSPGSQQHLPQGHQRKSRDRDRPRPHKHGQRDRWT